MTLPLPIAITPEARRLIGVALLLAAAALLALGALLARGPDPRALALAMTQITQQRLDAFAALAERGDEVAARWHVAEQSGMLGAALIADGEIRFPDPQGLLHVSDDATFADLRSVLPRLSAQGSGLHWWPSGDLARIIACDAGRAPQACAVFEEAALRAQVSGETGAPLLPSASGAGGIAGFGFWRWERAGRAFWPFLLGALVLASGGAGLLWPRVQRAAPERVEPRPAEPHPSVPLATSAPLLMGDLRIDRAALRAFRGNAMIELTPRDLALLQCLHDHAGEAVHRDVLFDAGWGRDHMPNSRSLDQYVSALRKKIERDPARPAIIRTVRGVGYRYDAA
ncbi:MAG: winged helix-turn-helix domain-containing protein [Neomegalonema sp.]|nr:winged helix-turn-helix domain-containing protein [Neomegalonema sp.]